MRLKVPKLSPTGWSYTTASRPSSGIPSIQLVGLLPVEKSLLSKKCSGRAGTELPTRSPSEVSIHSLNISVSTDESSPVFIFFRLKTTAGSSTTTTPLVGILGSGLTPPRSPLVLITGGSTPFFSGFLSTYLESSNDEPSSFAARVDSMMSSAQSRVGMARAFAGDRPGLLPRTFFEGELMVLPWRFARPRTERARSSLC
mmetsp:Transcript_106265/g.307695  ORF Transcript_106265/g.307695 Transcript_106265/m.307695 type:complete len:200 (+) Transcript_106265:3956-4555(+)